MTPQEAIKKHGLTVESHFVPFSLSRNKAEKNKNLNWIVTLRRNGREVLTTDYSAGVAHCPAYEIKGQSKQEKDALIAVECESGFAQILMTWGSVYKGRPIYPDSVNVIWCLVMDSGVLFYGGFEDWAAEYGYDTDSRKAESLYRQCLDSALKLQAALGPDALEELREAFQDY